MNYRIVICYAVKNLKDASTLSEILEENGFTILSIVFCEGKNIYEVDAEIKLHDTTLGNVIEKALRKLPAMYFLKYLRIDAYEEDEEIWNIKLKWI